mgnify:CR=1 FL=1
MHPPPFATAECINLVTRRRNGAEVATPVWFVLWNDTACLRTATRFGKVKRLGTASEREVDFSLYPG